MRIALALCALALVAGNAAAQPSQTSQVAVAAPYEYGMTTDDREVLDDGEIGGGRAIGGTLASVFVGYGVGAAIEGRYGSRGWIFTSGEAVTGSVMLVGFIGLAAGGGGKVAYGLALGGGVSYLGFRVWEVLDAALSPSMHNARYRAALARNPGYTQQAKLSPFLAPAARGDGGVVGLSLRF